MRKLCQWQCHLFRIRLRLSNKIERELGRLELPRKHPFHPAASHDPSCLQELDRPASCAGASPKKKHRFTKKHFDPKKHHVTSKKHCFSPGNPLKNFHPEKNTNYTWCFFGVAFHPKKSPTPPQKNTQPMDDSIGGSSGVTGLRVQ